MSLESQIASIHGSMNQDNTAKHVRTDQGQVIERINLRTNSKDGNKYYNEKIKGNLLISKTLPSGTNKVIGWCNDYENDAIIYFIYNDSLKHCIYRYFINTKTIQTLWYSEPALGFEDTYIKGAVVEGNLYWINGDQQPKSFDIDKAVNGEYTVLDEPYDENIFPLIKKPPQFSPECMYSQDTDYNFNNLRKKLFQFKYCFQYYDKQRSAWSPYSKVVLPINELTDDGEWNEDITVNNRIEVTIDTGGAQVEKILVAVRESNPNNIGSFFQFEEIKKFDADGERLMNDNEDYTFYFYNNKRTSSIDTTVNNRYCDHVPLSGNDILLLDNKYLAIAYPKEGYDGITPDYTLTAEQVEVDFDQTFITIEGVLKRWCFFCARYWVIFVPDTFHANAGYTISFEYNGVSYEYSQITGAAPIGDFPDYLTAAFVADMNTAGWDTATDSENDRKIWFMMDKDNIKNLQLVIRLEDETLMSYKSFKRGQYHSFGIIYNDDFGRYNIVYANNEFFSPVLDDWDDISYYVRCNWEINHAPPDWATSYRWCYIPKKTYTYFLYVPHVRCYLSTEGNITVDGETYENNIPANKYFLDINGAILGIKDLYPNSIIETYVWQNGDRARVIGNENSYEILSTWVLQSTTEDSTETITGFLVDEAPDIVDDYLRLLEIYRPNPEPQETVYYEIGEDFLVSTDVNGNKYHEGKSTDQSFDVNGNLLAPATGTFNFGDVYFRYRFGSDTVAQPVESQYYSDYYISNAIDIGRVGAKIDSEQKYLNRVVRSENYFENTEYNLLNVWLPSSQADYFDASDLYGNITGIQQVGEVLKVIQEHKETSVYIGRILAKEGDGGDIALDSSRVFGTQNEYIEIRGSKYNRSIVKNNRYLYYFDESTGEFIRSSANGQSPISSYFHMTNWFEKKAKALREYTGTKDVIVSCDNDYNEVLISFIIGTEIETLVFSEEENEKGWMYFVYYKTDSAIPDNFAFQGDTLLSFMNGRLYLHNEGVNNTFYGQLHPCSVKFVINVPAGQSKRFANIRINSDNNIWDVEFTTEDFVNYGLQKSILKPTIIREMNGRLHSDILGNIIQRNGVENLSLLHNGHDLVGEVLFVELSNDDNSDVVLGDCEVKYYINK